MQAALLHFNQSDCLVEPKQLNLIVNKTTNKYDNSESNQLSSLVLCWSYSYTILSRWKKAVEI